MSKEAKSALNTLMLWGYKGARETVATQASVNSARCACNTKIWCLVGVKISPGGLQKTPQFEHIEALSKRLECQINDAATWD